MKYYLVYSFDELEYHERIKEFDTKSEMVNWWKEKKECTFSEHYELLYVLAGKEVRIKELD